MTKPYIGGAILAAILSLGASHCEKRPLVPITIFHTNDLHSHLHPAAADPFQLGGVSRLSTLLNQLREKAGPHLTLDAGDWSEGTWHYNVDEGMNMLDLLARLRFDAAVLGVHDFFSGPDAVLFRQIEANRHHPAAPAILLANINPAEYSRRDELLSHLPPWIIREVGELKVGIIGLTTSSILYDSFFEPVKTTDPARAAAEAVARLRSEVDLLVLVSHIDFDENVSIARGVPGIDVIISGHGHVKTTVPIIVSHDNGQTIIVEGEKWGKFLGELRLQVDRDEKRAIVAGYQLHPVTRDIPEDPTVAAFVERQDRKLSERYGPIHEVIAYSELDLLHSEVAESPLTTLAVKAYRAATGADTALEIVSLSGIDVPAGEVTRSSLHDVSPHIYRKASGKEWTLHLWNARGRDLELIFQVFYTINGIVPGGVGWMAADNIHFTWDPGIFLQEFKGIDPGSIPAVHDIRIGGEPLKRNQRYTVAIHDGLLLAFRIANSKFFLGLDLSQVDDTGIETSQAVLDYARVPGRLTVENLRNGQIANTEEADLAVQYYGLQWDGRQLSAAIENQGLERSVQATLRCQVGTPDVAALYGSHDERWSGLQNVRIPPLKPGEKWVARIPWQGIQGATRMPVRCTVDSDSDAFAQNNVARRIVISPTAAASR